MAASSGEELKYPTLLTLRCLSVNLQWLPPVPSFLSSLRMQEIQILSLQEIFTDYLLSWLHSGFKSPLATCERTWLTLHRAPLQDHPPGATSTSSASKTELPGPFTYPTRSRSFPSSHFSSPLADLLITLSASSCSSSDQKYFLINLLKLFLFS
ncbi:hypothetical protein ATANTOWER_027161 [Ataeniobius toweri]|uniref:Uncharacterized protein n=1 Tax=Ataeniobius toweri TaxID=208326 RepID=A0ABU7BBE8_9TELE|nr:hypothetical protein [Ataeniobius toweri]